MATKEILPNIERSPYFGDMQDIVDALFKNKAPTEPVSRLEIILEVEANDLPDDLVEIVRLLPPGAYTRERLCKQLNSSIGGHAWGQVYGTVE